MSERAFRILLIPIFIFYALIFTKIISGVITLGRLPTFEDRFGYSPVFPITLFSSDTDGIILSILFLLSILCLLSLIPVAINIGEIKKNKYNMWLIFTIALITFHIILLKSSAYGFAAWFF